MTFKENFCQEFGMCPTNPSINEAENL